MRYVVSVLALAASASMASAFLVPASGPGTGTAQVAHQLIAKGANSANVVFQNPAFYSPTPTIGGSGGGLQSPGANYPAFGNLIGNRQVPLGIAANVPYTVTTPAGFFGADWGGATATLIGVAGNGRAGIAVTNSAVSNIGVNTLSVNTVGVSADYLNIGGPLFGVKFAQFLSHRATLVGGGFAAAAVRSQILIDPFGNVGGAFGINGGVTTINVNDLIMGFDGAGGNADFLNGTDPGLNVFNVVGNTVTFAGVSTSPAFNVPVGASLRLQGALTLIGDPATIEPIGFDSLIPLDDLVRDDVPLGIGFSTNADAVLPEPAMLSGLAPAALVLARRRRA